MAIFYNTHKKKYKQKSNLKNHIHHRSFFSSTPVSQIEKVFGAASHKKVWDHFTKAQRKNIDLWKRQSAVRTQKYN